MRSHFAAIKRFQSFPIYVFFCFTRNDDLVKYWFVVQKYSTYDIKETKEVQSSTSVLLIVAFVFWYYFDSSANAFKCVIDKWNNVSTFFGNSICILYKWKRVYDIMFLWRTTDAPLPHHCCTTAAPLLHYCCTTTAPLLHSPASYQLWHNLISHLTSPLGFCLRA